MLYLEILLPIYIFLSSLIFFFINKKWSKRNNVMLNVFYSLFLLIPYPIEIFVSNLIRMKYKKKTPEVIKLLQSKGIKFHIVFGTFLFAYRNSNFADNDIDIAIFRKDFNENIKRDLVELGFKLSEQWSLNNEISEQTYKHKKLKVSMDIFHMSSGEEFAPTFDEKNNRYSRRPVPYKYSVSPININGLIIDAPSNPEEYLKWNYGDWRVPDKNYHWFYGSSSSPTIVVENVNIKYEKFD